MFKKKKIVFEDKEYDLFRRNRLTFVQSFFNQQTPFGGH